MTLRWRPLAFIFALAALTPSGEASAQAPTSASRRIIVTQGSSTVETPVVVAPAKPEVVTARPRRLRNRYFARRPVFPQPLPGQRASVTFEPLTRWYQPTTNSYYPTPGTRP